MTDDLDPTRLLASAALDNEVTPDERAQVDASPSLTAEMATYATLRDHLGDVDVPAAARESAIDAALAVFDALQSGADASTDAATAAAAALAPPPAPPPNANVVSLHARRQRQYRWVGGIAAAAIVAVVGIAVVNGPGGGDDKKSSATLPVLRTEANDSTAKAAATTVPSLVSAAQAPAPAVETGTIAASAAGGAQQSATTAAAAETTEAYATETIEAATETTEASDSAADTFDPWVGARAFNTMPDVTAYALSPDSPVAPPALESAETTAGTEATDTSSAATSAAATTVAATVPPFGTAPSGSLYPCDTGDLLIAPIYWQGARALLVRNDPIDTFEVVSAATCAVLVTFPIP